MTEPDPRLPDSKQLRKTVVLWSALLLLIGIAWVLARVSSGDTAWEVAADALLWTSIVALLVLGARWLVRRPLSPEMQQVLLQLDRERSTCRHCRRPLKAQSITCSSCGKVVDWGVVIGAGLVMLVLLGLMVRGAFFAVQ